MTKYFWFLNKVQQLHEQMINVKTDTTDTATEGHTIYYLNTNTTTTYGTSFNSTPKLRISVPVPWLPWTIGHHLQFQSQCPNITTIQARI